MSRLRGTENTKHAKWRQQTATWCTPAVQPASTLSATRGSAAAVGLPPACNDAASAAAICQQHDSRREPAAAARCACVQTATRMDEWNLRVLRRLWSVWVWSERVLFSLSLSASVSLSLYLCLSLCFVSRQCLSILHSFFKQEASTIIKVHFKSHCRLQRTTGFFLNSRKSIDWFSCWIKTSAITLQVAACGFARRALPVSWPRTWERTAAFLCACRAGLSSLGQSFARSTIYT